MSISEKAFQELVDRQQISDVIHRYCRAADRLDIDLFKTVFWDDGVYEGGPADGPASAFIPALIGDVVRNMFVVSHHAVSNILIELDGDVAHAETYLVAYHLSHPTPESRAALIGRENAEAAGYADDQVIEFILGARYIDRFERRNGDWRIAKRKLVPEWNQVANYSGILKGGQLDLLRLRGSRDLSDPLYSP